MAALDRQKQLLKFLKRRHPDYEEMAAQWDFLEDTYEGGRGWFEDNIFRYIKEGDKEYKDRLERAYRFNHTHEVVDLVIKYLFKMEVHRSEEVSDGIKKFWKAATKENQSIRDFMRSVGTSVSIFGRGWIVIDSNLTADNAPKTLAEEKEVDARVYAYFVEPEHVLDIGYDGEGKLNWVLIRECVRDDADPITSTGEVQEQYRLWTKEFSQLFRIEKSGQRQTVVEEPPKYHNLGIVPVVNADNVLSDEKYTSTSMIADVAYLDRAVANYLSNLDAIIQDQTFSQLAMPAQGVTSGDDEYSKLLEMGTKRVFLFDSGEGNNQPFYLSPDVKQAELILKVINKIINEIYHSVGLAGERTKEDNALGIDNSSGVAKAYDFERVNSLLAAKADSMESVENRMLEIVALYLGDTEFAKREKPAVMYPDDFDVRGLYDEFEIAARLALIEAPDEMRRTQMEQVIDKLFPQLKKDLREKMEAELKTWPPKIDLANPATGASNSPLKKTGSQALASKLVAGAKRSAQV